jgi:hypothetical protein
MNPVRDLIRLTDPERKLVKAAERDTIADLRGYENGEQPLIRAYVLQELCAGDQWPVKDRIRMIGGHVQDRLDLSSAHVTHAMHFTDCVFRDAIDLRRARCEQPLTWEGGHISGIFADEFESSADLTIARVEIDGTVSLHWANISGDLRFTGSHLVQRAGRVINAADLRVGGTLFLDGHDFHAEGEVCISSAHVAGDLDCRHARFDNASGYSLNAAHIVVDGEVLCEQGFRSTGEVCLQWAQLHRLRATGGSFANPAGYALHADALLAKSGVYLDRDFHATGNVRLVGAYITGELCCTHGVFSNPSGHALDAERVKAEDIYLDRGFSAHGEVRFTDARVERQFNATDGKFRIECADGYALDADGLDCSGEVYLNEGFHATGTVSLTGAAIRGELNCTNGAFTKPDGYALFADGLTTPGFVYLDKKFCAIGEVRLARATVGRQLVCTGGVFDNQHGTAIDITGLVCRGDVLLKREDDGSGFRATGEILMRDAQITRDVDFTGARLHGDEGLDARGMRVGGCLTWILDYPPEGPVDLTGAQISRLKDTKESWPQGRYTLAGLACQSTGGSTLTVDQRIDWLRQTREYAPDTYQQLAQMYRRVGRESDAEKVLIASQRDLRRRGDLPRRSRGWNRFIDFSVGYGYRLYRPFLAVLFLGIVGWLLYALAQRSNLIWATGLQNQSARQKCPVGYSCFYPAPYSFQLLIPGLDLRETGQWLPDAGMKPWGLVMMIYTWSMIIFGWIAATAVIAGVARIFRKR